MAETIASTHCTDPRRDVQAEWARVAWKVTEWYHEVCFNAIGGKLLVERALLFWITLFLLQGWTLASDSVKDESLVVRRLRPGTLYRFIVRAQNSHGLSLPSPITGVVKTRGQSISDFIFFMYLSICLSICLSVYLSV